MDKELLSKEVYPAVYQAIEALRTRIEADFPQDSLADVYVVDEVHDGRYYHPQNALTEEGEFITIGRRALENYSPEMVASLIAHEFGHDALDHHLSGKGQRLDVYNQRFTEQERLLNREKECSATHFATKYASLKARIDYTKQMDEMERKYIDSYDFLLNRFKAWYHGYEGTEAMYHDRRIYPLQREVLEALHDVAFLDAPLGTPLTSQCKVKPAEEKAR